MKQFTFELKEKIYVGKFIKVFLFLPTKPWVNDKSRRYSGHDIIGKIASVKEGVVKHVEEKRNISRERSRHN